MNKLSIHFLFIFLCSGYFTIAQTTEVEYKKYFDSMEGKLDPLEGIWSKDCVSQYSVWDGIDDPETSFEMVAIKKGQNESYQIFYLDDKTQPKQPRYFERTANKGIYLYRDPFFSITANISLSGDGLTFTNEYTKYWYKNETLNEYLIKMYTDKGFSLSKSIELAKSSKEVISCQFLKSYPIKNNSVNSNISSGTGFAISKNGIIATNYHVIGNANKISVIGINGDFTIRYPAKVLLTDENNDVALIKLTDFTGTISIPYTIKKNQSNVDDDIYTLGYPLLATMGDEIKLTNGIISSKSGFKGDITSYQVSAPVQPGNSGGPLFDNQGNVIGIVNAKNLQAENASYAIKSTYLLNLIESTSTPITLNQTNTLAGKTFQQQVSSAKKFIYIIIVE